MSIHNLKPAGDLTEQEARERLALEAIACAEQFEEHAESHAIMQADFLKRAAQLRARAASLRQGAPNG